MKIKTNTSSMVLLGLAAAAVLCAQTGPALTTLYSFSGGDDGSMPYSPITAGEGGTLYGTTLDGGTFKDGVVFSLTPPAAPGAAWTETVLYDFNGTDGGDPDGGMVLAANGVLYGTTVGKANAGGKTANGTVFSLTPPSAPGKPWRQAVLYNFGAGAGPFGALAIGAGEVFYGTTQIGGAEGKGMVFSLTPPLAAGDPWTETELFSFNGRTDGSKPESGVVIGNGGVLYGSAANVFSLAPPAAPGGAWTETVLDNFEGSNSGSPYGVAIGSGGVLYGTTFDGGTGSNCNGGQSGCGTVFSMTPPAAPGGAWTETVIHNFAGGSDGSYPFPGSILLVGPGGVLYGTTEVGGTSNSGTVYSLTPPPAPGGAWTETVLYSFTGGSDGSEPLVGVVFGPGGLLYGTTTAGGTANSGTVFALQP